MNKFDGLVLNTTGIYALEFVESPDDDDDEPVLRKRVVLGWCPAEIVCDDGIKHDILATVWINPNTGDPEIAEEYGIYLTNGEDPPWQIRKWAERTKRMMAEWREEEKEEEEEEEKKEKKEKKKGTRR